jgi:hypothetical protein
VHKPLHIGSCSAYLQHNQATVQIHHIQRLLQIQKDAKKRLLLQVGQLLSQFGLNNSCPGTAAVLASAQAPMKLDGIQLPVHHMLNYFLDGLKQTNSAVVAAALWDLDDNNSAESC